MASQRNTALVLGIALALMPRATEAGPNKYGVHVSRFRNSTANAATVAQLGAAWVRINVLLGERDVDVRPYLDAGVDVLLTFSNRDPNNVDVSTYGNLDDWPNSGFPYLDKATYQAGVQRSLSLLLPYLSRGRRIWIQCENEVGDASKNDSMFWRGTWDQYMTQLQALYEVARRVDTRLLVVSTSLADETLEIAADPGDPRNAAVIAGIARLAATGNYDAVDLHFYRCPERIPAKVQAITALLPPGKIWISTENAGPDDRCPTTPQTYDGVDGVFEHEQATAVPLRLSLCAEQGGAMCLWFALFDMKGTGWDDHFGLIDPTVLPHREKLAYAAFEAFTHPAILVGPGFGPTNENIARTYNAGAELFADFAAYAAGTYGLNVASAELTGSTPDEILTGPGPGPVHGPQVRAFASDGTALGRINFYAYGTLRYGVNLAAGDVDGDGVAEILSGPGPGTVFGPHVRGWNFDGNALTAIAKISYFAYGTLKYGVGISSGSTDSDVFAEIVTGPGPGATFAPQVRAFDYDDASVTACAKVNFNAFATSQFGAVVGAADFDGDGFAELVAARGPGPTLPSEVLGFNVDGGFPAALPGFSTIPYAASLYGARVGGAQTTGDAATDLVTGPGPDPAAAATACTFPYDGHALSPGRRFDAFATAYGVSVAGGMF